MNLTDYCTFLAAVRDQLAANDAAREAHIAALVAGADFAAWSVEMGRVGA